MEIWRDVVGYENMFSVSESGRMKNKITGTLLKHHIAKSGYVYVATRIGGRSGVNKTFRMHRVVAEAFLPSPSEALVNTCSSQHWGKVIVRHMDHNKQNNHWSNLQWGTSKDNAQDSIEQMRLSAVRGVEHPSAEFSDDDIKYIRSVYIARHKEFGCRALALKYGVVHSCISRIINNLSYSN